MIQAEELTSIPVFACLSEAQSTRLAQTTADLHVRAGEWVIREGDVPWFFVLLKASLDVVKEFGGQDVVVNRYKPGDFFGETPILLSVAGDCVACARTRTSRVVRLDKQQFKELIDQSAECSAIIMQTMSETRVDDSGIHARTTMRRGCWWWGRSTTRIAGRYGRFFR